MLFRQITQRNIFCEKLPASVGKMGLAGKILEGHGCLEPEAGMGDFVALLSEAGACLAVAVSVGK